MTLHSPLESHVVFQIGPVPLTEPVLVTWLLMAAIAGACWWITRRWDVEKPTVAQTLLDWVVALVVLLATVGFGIRQLGVRTYLQSFLRPSWLLAPLNLLEMATRSFSLMVRLFGNVMSGVFMIGIVLSLAGLFVPIPLMALELLTGAVQAYIFSALALVFVSSALIESPPDLKE